MGLKINGIPVAGLGLPGKDGTDGRSAYQIAQDGGYQGSEAEFAELLATAASQSYVDQKISEIPTPDVSGQINEHNADDTSHADIRATLNGAIELVDRELDSKAPMYTYSTTDLTAGSSSLEKGKLYFVYE